ncbi:hypothetical protein B9Z42_12555 [Limnohabitans sp. B9-3]|nr:hypothetical protein B9Z42_12555 [Limnohabitans sp. B9-3]
MLETFVFGELLKQTTTSDGDYRLMYYRDADKYEVDMVIENAAGHLGCPTLELVGLMTFKPSNWAAVEK